MAERKLIIFDFDGVLREVSWIHLYNAYRKLIEHTGKDPATFFTDVDSFRKWTDPDWHQNEMRILGHNEYVLNKEFNKVFHDNYDPNIKLFPWVPETLGLLSKKYQLAVLSSSIKESVRGELGELSRHFSLIVGGEDVIGLKPDPEGVFLILEQTRVRAKDAIIIGDMEVDFLAGKKAGIKTGLVKWGLGDWKKLRSLGADLLFEDPKDLARL